MFVPSFALELHNPSRSEERAFSFVVLKLRNDFERHRFQVLLDLGRRCSTRVVPRNFDHSLTRHSLTADSDPTSSEPSSIRLLIIHHLHFQETSISLILVL